MTPDDRLLRPRPGSVIAETMGDETMVIDAETGIFHSLRGVASVLWSLLEGGASTDDLVAAVRGQYPEVDAGEADVRTFTARLVDAGLIVAADATPTDVARPRPVPWPDAYGPPAVETHRDMADLLLVDPLHDVDDTGWPRSKP